MNNAQTVGDVAKSFSWSLSFWVIQTLKTF